MEEASELTFSDRFWASSRLCGRTCVASGRMVVKRSPKYGEEGGYTPPVVIRCIARENPINRGRKYEAQDSMVSPRLVNTKPYLLFS